MRITAIIPARLASSRLPGKALARIGDKTMIQMVYEQALKADRLDQVVIATDHSSIYNEAVNFGARVVMTASTHTSGTDRCLEAMKTSGFLMDFVINIQGDEPFISPDQINLLASMCQEDTEIATLIQPITESKEIFNLNVVKVVKNSLQEALYFSRAAIPAQRDVPTEEWFNNTPYYKHIGMYAYRRDILEKIARLPTSGLEKAESLEQLRWLEEGYRIKVAETTIPAFGVDTPEDLAHARQLYQEKAGK
jgi:3-deoxy-manno-octulosonate cytidylyltransferase (CMP-KDO synthetase)